MSKAQQSWGQGLFLPPIVLQLIGVAIIVAASVFWALTGHESVLIMGTGVTLTGIGAYSGLHISLRQELSRRDPGEEE